MWQAIVNVKDHEALLSPGDCYCNGVGAERSNDAAVECYKRTAEEQVVLVRSRIGDCFLKGAGISCDLEIADRRYETAANSGEPEVFMPIAIYYARGLDVEKNHPCQQY